MLPRISEEHENYAEPLSSGMADASITSSKRLKKEGVPIGLPMAQFSRLRNFTTTKTPRDEEEKQDMANVPLDSFDAMDTINEEFPPEIGLKEDEAFEALDGEATLVGDAPILDV